MNNKRRILKSVFSGLRKIQSKLEKVTFMFKLISSISTTVYFSIVCFILKKSKLVSNSKWFIVTLLLISLKKIVDLVNQKRKWKNQNQICKSKICRTPPRNLFMFWQIFSFLWWQNRQCFWENQFISCSKMLFPIWTKVTSGTY